jgi:hypothetical protein
MLEEMAAGHSEFNLPRPIMVRAREVARGKK